MEERRTEAGLEWKEGKRGELKRNRWERKRREEEVKGRRRKGRIEQKKRKER